MFYQSPKWLRLSAQCRERDGWVCRVCGRDPGRSKLHAHHKIPRAKGGPDVLDNLISLCETCHNHEHRLLKKGRSLFTQAARRPKPKQPKAPPSPPHNREEWAAKAREQRAELRQRAGWVQIGRNVYQRPPR